MKPGDYVVFVISMGQHSLTKNKIYKILHTSNPIQNLFFQRVTIIDDCNKELTLLDLYFRKATEEEIYNFKFTNALEEFINDSNNEDL
jgi:hypothetical protein